MQPEEKNPGPGSAPGYVLSLSYPNPFNPTATIHYGIERFGHVSLRIYDVAGHLVRSFELSNQPVGESAVEWDGKNQRGRMVNGGTYLVRLETSDAQDVLRVTLVK